MYLVLCGSVPKYGLQIKLHQLNVCSLTREMITNHIFVEAQMELVESATPAARQIRKGTALRAVKL